MPSSILNATVMAHLNKTNYLTWNVHMRVLLIHSDLWGIVSGKEAVPDPRTVASMKVKAYALCQLKAAAEIALYVDDSQIIHVQGDDPKVIWDTLTSIHRTCGLSIQLVATVSNKTVPITNPNTVREAHCNHTWEFRLALV